MEAQIGKTRRKQFIDQLVAHSKATVYSEACQEWRLKKSKTVSIAKHCICGQPIHQVFYIKNHITEKTVKIGCDCKKHFTDDAQVAKQINEKIKEVNQMKRMDRKVLITGKYAGKTYLEIFRDHPDYCHFIKDIKVKDKQLLKFQKYICLKIDLKN